MQIPFGDKNWRFSDDVLKKLTGKNISSDYSPTLSVSLIEFPNLAEGKKFYVLFWGTPTFKDIESQYLFHVFDHEDYDLIISTSSGNTVEGMARSIKIYNEKMGKNKKVLLLVPELSSYKVSESVIVDNPYVIYVVLKNSTLDSTREYAQIIKNNLNNKIKIITSNSDIKTAAYSQIGLILQGTNLLNSNTCYVQTVSGGVGPTGLMEASKLLDKKPELMIIQPKESISGPVIQALNEDSLGNDPFSIFKKIKFQTPLMEPTLGSTKPIYVIEKLLEWRENKGIVYTGDVSETDLTENLAILFKRLIESGIFRNMSECEKYFKVEKSGFIALKGAILHSDKINADNIVVNFTGRRPMLDTNIIPAKPHIIIDPYKDKIDLIIKLTKKITFS